MAMFDYKNYTSEESKEKVLTSLALSRYRTDDSEDGHPRAEDHSATLDNKDRAAFDKLPSGWREVEPKKLGLPESAIDKKGYYAIDTSIKPFGSDARLNPGRPVENFVEKLTPSNKIFDIAGNLVGVATNSIGNALANRTLDKVSGEEGGIQAKVLTKTDADGKVTKIAIAFASTNDGVKDYLEIPRFNSGEAWNKFEPLLQKVKAFAEANGLKAEDILVTGESFGGAMTNIMARFRDKLADGFFSNSDYIAHGSPVIYDNPEVISNIGYENDVVFRHLGDESNNNALEAVVGNIVEHGGVKNPDLNYESSPDNFILFDDTYAKHGHSDGFDVIDQVTLWGIQNFGVAWKAHYNAILTDAIARTTDSPFYQFTNRDSVVITAALSESMREKTWVEDFETPLSDHYGNPAHIVGSEYDDRLGGGKSDDYIFGGVGDDTIRLFRKGDQATGVDRIDGGDGQDTLILGSAEDTWDTYRLSDGTLFFDSKNGNGLKQVENVESFKFDGSTSPLSAKALASNAHKEGTTGDEYEILIAKVVFAQAGNDTLMAANGGNSLLHAGEGDDILHAVGDGDRLYGAEDNDVLVAQGNNILHGGLGNDSFVFKSPYQGQSVIEDFNQNAGDLDRLMFDDELFGSLDEMRASATQSGNDVVIAIGDGSHVTIKNIGIAELQDHSLIMA